MKLRIKKEVRSIKEEPPPLFETSFSHNKLHREKTNQITKHLYSVYNNNNEDKITPFWNTDSFLLSQHIWLPCPASIDEIDLPVSNSWFSVKEEIKNDIVFNPSLCTLPDTIKPVNTKVKTLKGRFFPTEQEKLQLQELMEQSRWYYNGILSCFKSRYRTNEDIVKKKKFSDYEIRDILTDYVYIEEEDTQEDEIIKYFERKTIPTTKQFNPPWWNKVHTRVPRGAAKKMTQNVNSAISNFKNGHITEFDFKYRSKKKSPTEFVLFEDRNYPSFLRQIKSHYWYTDINGKKVRCSFLDLFSQGKQRGLEIIYEKKTDKYFFHYVVDSDFYPLNDRRHENQGLLSATGRNSRIITIDLGVRKFGVGYDPSGKIVYIGEGAHKELISLLYSVDKKPSFLLWKRIKSLVSELHWKTINYLMLHYDHIIVPDFRISGMVKGKKLSRTTKRLLYMFSYYSFTTKLKYKCSINNKRLSIVNESYTSKTCTFCGYLNNVGSSETYKCNECEIVLDRDVVGGRNIFIKNVKLN